MFGKRQKENNLEEIKPKGKKKKGRKKKVIAGVVIVAVLGTAGTAVYSKTQKQLGNHSEVKEAQSAEVTLGNISNTIVGTGNLELDEAQEVTIPSGLTVSDVYVESGDQVLAGTVLASVDKSSVLSAVENVQEEIEELDEKISECQSDSTANTITSTVAGRVKAIYVAADSEVTDVMLDKGSLMELSLDGLMAVKLENVTGVTAGDTVTVTLSDGSTVSGAIESAEENTCVVTLTDNGTTLDDTVTVTDADGNDLGSGTLYIHESFEITGTTGTVASVSVSENEKVTSGEKLIVLNGVESDSEYEELMATREARTATLKKLLSLTKNPQIAADQDGTIQDVNVSASQTTDTTTSSGTSNDTGVSKMSYTRSVNMTNGNSTVSFQKLSFDDGTTATEMQTFSEQEITSDETEGSDSEPGADVVPVDTEISFSVVNEGTSDSTQVVVTAPAKGATPVTEINASDGSYKGVITWNPNDSTFAADTAYQALVLLSASDGYCFTTNSIQGTAIGTVSGIQVTDNGKTLEFQIAFPQTAADDKKENDDNKTDNNGNTASDGNATENGSTNNGENSGSSVINDYTANTSEGTQNSGNSQNNAGNTANGNTGGTGQSTASGAGSASTQQSSETADSSESSSKTESSQYSTDVTAFTISPNENMCLSVSVDELDINSVEEGQAAVVTFDAIENKEFEGEVTKIGSTASVNGGVAKYTVEITIPKDDEMKQGMNASATITTEERKDVLTLPMNALQEQGNKTFVYTEKKSDGTLSGEVEIQTGLTDGSTVEITDGLEEGDTVYYMRSDNSQSNSSSSNDMADMAGGPGGNGDMPGGNFGGGSDGNSTGGPGGNGGSAPGGGQGGPGM